MQSVPVNQRIRINILQAACIVAAATVLFAKPMVEAHAHRYVAFAGLLLVMICIAGRTWCTLYIGSRKNSQLITAGPYSMTRNPLYLFSTIGAAGVGLMTGSFVVALVFGLIAYLILNETARRESVHLRNLFGPDYDAYASRTPMFWPNPSLYFEPKSWDFSPRLVRRTFRDATMFLLAYPAIELVAYLQRSGYLPTYILLP